MKIAFLFRDPIEVPLNLREYYISMELLSRGHEIVWLMLFKEEAHGSDLVIDCSKFRTIHKDTDQAGSFFSQVNDICETLEDQKVEAVWISGWFMRWPRNLFILLKGLRKKACKIVYDPIDPIYEYVVSAQSSKIGFFKKLSLKLQLRFCYKQCELILAVTPQFKKILIGYGLPETRIDVAMWGTDIARFNYRKPPQNNPFRDLPQLKNKIVIGWLGTMSRFKGLEEILIPVIKRLSPLNEKVAFLLAGSGPLYDHLAEIAESFPPGFVTLLGNIPYDQAPAFTVALDCYLVPTNPFNTMGKSIVPVKIFDALAMGVPVITTRSEAIEAVAGELKGMTLVNWGVDPFYDAIGHMIQNYQEIKQSAVEGIAPARCFSHQYINKSLASRLEALFY